MFFFQVAEHQKSFSHLSRGSLLNFPAYPAVRDFHFFTCHFGYCLPPRENNPIIESVYSGETIYFFSLRAKVQLVLALHLIKLPPLWRVFHCVFFFSSYLSFFPPRSRLTSSRFLFVAEIITYTLLRRWEVWLSFPARAPRGLVPLSDSKSKTPMYHSMVFNRMAGESYFLLLSLFTYTHMSLYTPFVEKNERFTS